MIARFFKIENELRGVRAIEVPRHADIQVFRDIFPTLTRFDEAMVGLQDKDVTVASARGTLDALLEDYPEPSHYLAQDAAIVHDLVFF
ncbi:hypothetical protein Pcac1_g7633 [Phytophthora cactorum]|uniref:Uncharacterized protein n=1 Tax=Phytophthora cactorum TaxID=29920 RepID=A0A329S725_9STRA|nr:hypothetical protein Pcac1_g7633 [Phytophthora cactorum]KAG2801963.1 hypothetical protein PC112_g19830 [Phytophthora cactorum]RAW31332.1 hypothetical protein PC110_g12311 [Phytophthora cactorum]